MKKVFLATSFSHKINPATGEVLPDFRKFIESIIDGLRKTGNYEVFCAMEHEGWAISKEPPVVSVKKDLQEVDKSDILLSILYDKPSAGIQFEVGYALGKDKQIFLALDNDGELAYFNKGVVSLPNVHHLTYDSSESLVSQFIESSKP